MNQRVALVLGGLNCTPEWGADGWEKTGMLGGCAFPQDSWLSLSGCIIDMDVDAVQLSIRRFLRLGLAGTQDSGAIRVRRYIYTSTFRVCRSYVIKMQHNMYTIGTVRSM